jgi:hypothetical protein
MTREEFASLQKAFPTASTVWLDRMFDMEKDKLVHELIQHMEARTLRGILTNIQKDVIESREEDIYDD